MSRSGYHEALEPELDTGDLPPFCPRCNGMGLMKLKVATGHMACPYCDGTGWDRTDPAYEIEAHMQDTLTDDETRDEFGELKEDVA